MQDSLGKAVRPFEAEAVKSALRFLVAPKADGSKQLVLWLEAESAYKKRDQALWAEMRKLHEADNVSIAYLMMRYPCEAEHR